MRVHRRFQGSLQLGVLFFAGVAAAAANPIHARRATSSVRIDGLLDEPAWSEARPYDAFVETFPKDGAQVPPEFRTVAKVLYDDDYLYVGIHSHDPEPAKIQAQLSRRDTIPNSDYVEVGIDSARQGTTGYVFVVNAAGVQKDRLLYGDVSSTDSWDAVWAADAKVVDDGWTAELAIPLRVLRFSRKPEQIFGIDIRRVIPRTHQTFDSTYVPRSANPQNPGDFVVSRFQPLVDLTQLEPKSNIQLAPYVAARATERPQFSDPTRPRPTSFDPSVDVGLDVAASLLSDLNLAVTLNPDFGQVEADQIIQNVNTFEQFFPEKRPFFNQGLDLFQPIGAEYGAQMQLFYSRRIGLAAPIFGAAKLTGSVREGTEVGVLDAVVLGPANPAIGAAAYLGEDLTPFEADPDRRWQFHPSRPLHFGANYALPAERPVSLNAFAAALRQQVGPRARVGAMVTSAAPLAPRCTLADFPTREEFESVDCTALGANAASLDGMIRSEGGEWGILGQLTASQALGGPADGRVLEDGTVMRRGDIGYGATLRAGRLSGDGLRFDVFGIYMSPQLQLNDLGFQPFPNYQWYTLSLKYVKSNGFGPFPSGAVSYHFDGLNRSTDGRWLPRGNNHSVSGQLQLPSFDTLHLDAGYEHQQYDLREIPFAGIAVERSPSVWAALGISTDRSRRLSGFAGVVGSHLFGAGSVPSADGWQLNGNLTWHPAPFLETYFEANLARRATGARFLGPDEAGNAVFGAQAPSFLSLTLRQQLVITPRLTLQAYAQLFSGAIGYGPFFSTTLQGRDRIDVLELMPFAFAANPDQHFSALNLNLVARWEYRLGSTLYVVYTRSQEELAAAAGSASTSVLPARLWDGPMSQSLQLKWSYWWDV